MKLLITSLIILCSQAFASSTRSLELDIDKNVLISQSKLDDLKAKERLLEALINNSEYIQFIDGEALYQNDINDMKQSTILEAIKAFKVIEGGGTGAGG